MIVRNRNENMSDSSTRELYNAPLGEANHCQTRDWGSDRGNVTLKRGVAERGTGRPVAKTGKARQR